MNLLSTCLTRTTNAAFLINVGSLRVTKCNYVQTELDSKVRFKHVEGKTKLKCKHTHVNMRVGDGGVELAEGGVGAGVLMRLMNT